MKKSLEKKLKQLPLNPGVYFHKDKTGEIIYVGKAAVLKNRVRQYFQNNRNQDIKTKKLVSEIDDVDWAETDSEIDALFLEAEMVKRYMPKYNILLRDDKSQIFVRIDMKSQWPYVSFTRNPADDNASYYGPYYNGFAVKKALRYLRKVFPYYTKPQKTDTRLDLDDHIGLSPTGMTSSEYKSNLKRLISYMQGGRKAIIKALTKEMDLAASTHDYETAALIRNRLRDLRELQQRIMFGDKEFLDISKDQALSDLSELLGLSTVPTRIEGFDISHMSGVDVVASMVVFTNGVSDRKEYRKFKTRRDINDDFANMREVITRRFSEKNIKSWGLPQLILIDGGKGQLDSAIKSLTESGNSTIPIIGLAKVREQIIVGKTGSNAAASNVKVNQLGGYAEDSRDYRIISLPASTHIIKLLQRIRDESHRFAVSYHSVLKQNRQTRSILDEIPGIGQKTYSKLIREFSSLSGIKNASIDEIAKVIGATKAKIVILYLKDV